MSDCADMTTALARELTQGIRDEVEDLSAVFKKMAALKPAAEQDMAEPVDENADAGDIGTAAGNGDTADGIAVREGMAAYRRRIRIIDDTSKMTAYSTSAPIPAFAVLSFVNSTKPAMDGRICGCFEERMAA